MSSEEIAASMIGAFPPGVPELLAPDDKDGGAVTRHLGCIAKTVQDTAIAAIEELERDITPLTCGSYRLREWEKALGLAYSRTARSGTLAARRAAVISRLREYGPPTKAMLQAVLAPLLDYADPTQLVILECDRAALRTAHTYAGSKTRGGFTYATPAVWDFWVNDADSVAPGCPQADLTLTAADLSKVAAEIETPDGSHFRLNFGQLGRGLCIARTIRAYWQGVTTSNVLGRWRLTVWLDGAGLGVLNDATFFCEGFGRRGRSAAQFEWAAVYEPSKSRGAPDFDAAREAVRRVGFATRIGGLVFPADASVGLPATDYGMIPNDNAIPSGFVPG